MGVRPGFPLTQGFAVQNDPIIRAAVREDLPALAQLSAATFGPGRFARTAYRVREGAPPVSPYCRVCLIGERIIAAVRFTPILIGGQGAALLLGPLVVDPEFANQGHGRGLAAGALEAAGANGVRLVVLVGDEPYYGKLGFRRIPRGQITLPGPVDPDRLLAAELVEGSLTDYAGGIVAAPSA